MIEKLECTCIEAYKTRKMRDPNCCACSCDHNDLVEQLAKANESVRERSEELVNRHNQIQELRQENGEYAILIANLVRRADVKTDLLQNPTFEKASEQLNKFAIDKKIEALEFILGRVEPVTVSHAVKDHIVYYIEQLRKEQSND